jgi:hypothetical protein
MMLRPGRIQKHDAAVHTHPALYPAPARVQAPRPHQCRGVQAVWLRDKFPAIKKSECLLHRTWVRSAGSHETFGMRKTAVRPVVDDEEDLAATAGNEINLGAAGNDWLAANRRRIELFRLSIPEDKYRAELTIESIRSRRLSSPEDQLQECLRVSCGV